MLPGMISAGTRFPGEGFVVPGRSRFLTVLTGAMQLACFRGWPEGVAAVLDVSELDPMVAISPAGDTPLHWLCKVGSTWATTDVNGTSVEVESALTALVEPCQLKPSQVRGLVTVRPSPTPSTHKI